MFKNLYKSIFVVLLSICLSCNSSDVKNAVDLADGVPRKDIDRGYLAINAFANDSQFGTPSEQFTQVRDQLGITRVRLLFAWNNQVQPTRVSEPDYGFYDFILSSLPQNMQAIVVLTDVPTWVSELPNPRQAFATEWVRKVVNRYGGDSRIEGFQIWNEPNDLNNVNNTRVGVVGQPANYVELLAASANEVKDGPGSKLVISASTTAINQNYPDSLDYYKDIRDAGAEQFVDVWGVHYYGTQYENVLRNGGVKDFLNALQKPIWVTESGETGFNKQLEYAETAWPFLIDNIEGLQRIYIYQYAENSAAANTYGLRNPDQANSVSDLYIFLNQSR
jgi:Cellulase (glycosyl hydrolase family 5)